MVETNYTLNPKEHNQGGRNAPYEKYHLTEAQHTRATRLATSTQDGLMPASLVGAVEYVDAPATMDAPGEIGQRAIDGNYVYHYTPNGWRRSLLEQFAEISSSSYSSQSSSSSSESSASSESSQSSSSQSSSSSSLGITSSSSSSLSSDSSSSSLGITSSSSQSSSSSSSSLGITSSSSSSTVNKSTSSDSSQSSSSSSPSSQSSSSSSSLGITSSSSSSSSSLGITSSSSSSSSSDSSSSSNIPALVAHYKMNDNAANTVVVNDQGVNGTSVNFNTSDNSVAGVINTALDFSATNSPFDHIDTNLTYNNIFRKPFSVALWANRDGAGGMILGVEDGSDTFYIQSGSGNILCVYGENGNTAIARADVPLSSPGHVVVTVDYPNIKIYKNGELIPLNPSFDGDMTGVTMSNFDNSNRNLYLGAINDNGVVNNWFNGYLDDVRIYDEPISETLINNIYNNGNGTEATDPPDNSSSSSSNSSSSSSSSSSSLGITSSSSSSLGITSSSSSSSTINNSTSSEGFTSTSSEVMTTSSSSSTLERSTSSDSSESSSSSPSSESSSSTINQSTSSDSTINESTSSISDSESSLLGGEAALSEGGEELLWEDGDAIVWD
jgi:hypothetical protein